MLNLDVDSLGHRAQHRTTKMGSTVLDDVETICWDLQSPGRFRRSYAFTDNTVKRCFVPSLL